MGYNMFLSILTVLGMLISDIMYMVVDPVLNYHKGWIQMALSNENEKKQNYTDIQDYNETEAEQHFRVISPAYGG